MKISQLILELQIPRFEDVYYPLDDSFLLIDYLDTPEFEDFLKKKSESKKDVQILDMGCGTGILGFCILYKMIESKFFTKIHLTFTDINSQAIGTAKSMMSENFHQLIRLTSFKDTSVTTSYHTSDLFDEITSQIFDLIVFNPPYLPQDEEIRDPKPIDQALYGGPEGISVLKKFFLKLSPYVDYNSHVFFIASSLGAMHKLLPVVTSKFHVKLLQNIHMFFEDFGLFCAKMIPKITNKV